MIPVLSIKMGACPGDTMWEDSMATRWHTPGLMAGALALILMAAPLAARAGEEPAAPRKASAPPVRPELYDSSLRPGQVLRTSRTPFKTLAMAPKVPVLAPQVPAVTTWAREDLPPPPPLPPLGELPAPAPDNTPLVPIARDYPAAPAIPAAPALADEPPMPTAPPAAVEVVPDEMPAPGPETVIDEVAPPPPPAEAVRLVQAPAGVGPTTITGQAVRCVSDCMQKRDACCWPLDWCGNRYGRWEVALEGSYNGLNSPEGLLGEPIFGASDQFDWESLDFEGAFGGRVTVRYALAPMRWLELKGIYYGENSDDSTQIGRFGFLPGPAGIGGASAPVNGRMSAESESWSGELNFVSEFSCTGCMRFDLLLGARYMRLEEQARVDFDPNAGIANFNGPAFVEARTSNTLFGGQVGVQGHYDLSERFTITGGLKVILGNMSRDADIEDRSVFIGGSHASRSTQEELVFAADIELRARWRIMPRAAITFGYNLFFADNVLHAYDAMDFTKSTSGAVQARQEVGQMINHSIFAGVEFNF